jgi:hypothetical protein
MLRHIRAALVLAVMFLPACATVGGIQNAPLTAGVSRTFEKDFDATVKAARESVVEAGLQIESVREVDENTFFIIGKKGTSAFSWGELVRVAVVREAESRTRVSVHTQRRVATNVTARGDYSEPILSNLALKLR